MAMDEEHQFILGKIDTVETKLESKMEAQFTRIGNKLEQMVELLQTVAQLQERENRNTNDIIDLRTSLRDSIDTYTKTTVRVHERVDKQEHEAHAVVSTLIKEIDDKLTKASEANAAKHENVVATVRVVETKLNTWLNRGLGAWASASVLLLVIQAIGGYLLSSTKDDFLAVRNQVIVIEKRVAEAEQNLLLLHVRNPPAKDPKPQQ